MHGLIVKEAEKETTNEDHSWKCSMYANLKIDSEACKEQAICKYG